MMPTAKKMKQMFPFVDGRYMPSLRAGSIGLLIVIKSPKSLGIFRLVVVNL
jgi:hypothetical protein